MSSHLSYLSNMLIIVVVCVCVFARARAYIRKNRAKVGRMSRALISKLVERKGEGASAEGYKTQVRPLSLTVQKTAPLHPLRGASPIDRNSAEVSWIAPSLYMIRGKNGLRISLCSSSSGLVFLAEARDFDSGLVLGGF